MEQSSVLIELRAGEGGEDARRLVELQLSIYLKRVQTFRRTQGGTAMRPASTAMRPASTAMRPDSTGRL